MRVKITTFVPEENAELVRRSLGEAGAGLIGEYSYCSFTTMGVGRFTPSSSANPHIGAHGITEMVNEQRIEVVCEKSIAKKVVKVLKKVHPYEEVAFDIVPLLDESDL